MARKKIQMKKIEDNQKKYVTFSKRRAGLFKKAYELSVLCDTEVGLVVITPSGKFSYLAAKQSLEDMLLEFVSRPDVQLPRDLIPHKESLTVLLENMKVEEETDVAGLSNQNATPSTHLTDQDIKNVEEKSRSILQLLSLVRDRKDNLSAQLTAASSSIPSTAASTSYQCEAPNNFDWMAHEAQYYGPPGGDPGASSSSQPPLQMLTQPEVMQEDDGRWQ